MPQKFTYLICYDISEPKLLHKTAHYLEKIGGTRLQKSVFILSLPQHQIHRIKDHLKQMIGIKHHVMVIPICNLCLNKAEFLGESPALYYLL
ncbi:MAG: CRISPR-associated endonuclease Cas2 [Desulfobacterales bacterium]|nr:CRISPR-associated endonuclease Cas2 [Desulfobacterales bacterium]